MALNRQGSSSANLNASSSQANRVSFVCQRCLQPLRIHPSFYAMDEHTLAELSLPICPASTYEPPKTTTDITVPPFKLEESNTEFTLVDEEGDNVGAISSRLKTTMELFDLVSNNTEVDHPLCEECTDSMLEMMDQHLKLAEDEAQQYQAYLNKLSKESEDDNQVDALKKELEDLKLEEEKLKNDLDLLKKEEAQADADLVKQMETKDLLEKEEQKFWKEYSKYKRELLLAEDDYRSLDCRLKYTQNQLEKLKKMNVFNATFHIWHTGHFATINGFRLGRLPSVPVEWSEINAAWGHTAFLLSCLAKAIGLEEFQRFQLVPYGNFSYVKVRDMTKSIKDLFNTLFQVLADGKSLPLYGSGGFRLNFLDSKFDSGMVAFLDCLQQFASFIEKQGEFTLPYKMEKGKIKDNNTGQFYSVKMQFNSLELWTKAMRYMLTNLKWGLAFVSTKYMKQDKAKSAEESEASRESSAS